MKRHILLSFILLTLCAAITVRAQASAALLLEEPFGHFGALTATGHAAVYLPRVCASSPVVLRRCAEGETGVVISRYNRVGGYDWIAVPLIPYLYAVESSDDVPLFANAKLVAFLRDQYRRKHLEDIAPDAADGEAPSGNWVQLLGAAFDRTLYSYEIETSEAQDDELIRILNSRPNQSHFHLLSRNCADFAREILDFYHPKAVHRSIVADLGITTPKQLAKTLVRYSRRNSDLEFSSFVIPQVPGSVVRSTPPYGVLESFLKSKKYLVPLAALHPIVMAGVAVAYLGTGRFDPAHHQQVFDEARELQPPLDPSERRDYEDQLKALLARMDIQRETWHDSIVGKDKKWSHLEMSAEPGLDDLGRPILKLMVDQRLVDVGISRGNILNSSTPPILVEEIMTSRLQEELRRNAASRTSRTDVINDWNILLRATPSMGMD